MGSTEMKPQRTTPPWENRVERAYRALRSRTDASASYRGVLRSRTPSSARSSRSSGPRRRCLRPRCFLWGEDSECAWETSTSGVVKKKHHVTHFVFIIVTLKVNDGDPEHAALQPSINREREEEIWRAETAKRYSPNILFSFVEFLSQIFSRGLTGDLNHGQLLAIASHVAGGLTHTVIVVFLYQKVCGWSESFKNNVITARESNKPDTQALRFLPKITLHTAGRRKETKNKRKIAAIVHFPWKQVMTEKWGESFCGIYLILAEQRHVTNPPNGIFKQSFTVLFRSSWAESNFKLTLLLNQYFCGCAACHIQTLNLLSFVFFIKFLQCKCSPRAGSAQSLYCSGVQTVEVPVENENPK